jgi:signal transduction histidine kinase
MIDDETRHRALMGGLTAGITHELSNPLAYMLANIDYVLIELGRCEARDPTLNECARALTQVKTGTLQLRALTRALKALAQPLGHTTTLDVSQLMEHALLVTRGTWKHSASIDVESLTGLRVVCDEALVMRWLTHRVLDTLGRLGLDSAERTRVVIRAEREGHSLWLSVHVVSGVDSARGQEPARLELTIAHD